MYFDFSMILLVNTHVMEYQLHLLGYNEYNPEN